MVNLTRRFKLEYEDVNDGTTIIAETGQNTGAPEIDRHVHIRRKNDPDILKLWIEEPDFGNTIPTDRNDFANAQNGENEPEILYKQYDRDSDSFVTKGRFYAKNAGSINEDGQLAVKLYSFMKYTAKQDVNASSSQDLEDAMNQVLPSGYVADVPSGVTPPNVENYSVSSTRQTGYQELTRNYNYAMTFTANLDGSNNYKVKFEPVGQGGTVDTLVDRDQSGRYPIVDVDTGTNTFFIRGDKTNDLVVNQVIQVDGSTGNDGSYTISALNYDSTDNETDITVNENVSDSTADGSILPGGNAKFESWEKDKTESVVNKVEVKGVNKQTKTLIKGEANNTDLQDKVGVKKKEVKVGYFNSANDSDAQTEADNIAENFLVPSKSSDQLPESGRVKTAVYSDNVVNDSFQVVSNRLNIDDTYTVVQQRNFWPEGTSKIEFEFEQEGLEKAARESENLRGERARLFPAQGTDVGNQVVDADTENVNDQYDAHNAGNHPHDVGGKGSTFDGGAAAIDDDDSIETFASGIDDTFSSVATFSPDFEDSAGVVFYVTFQKTSSETTTQQNILEWRILHDFDDDGALEEIHAQPDESSKYPKSGLYQDTDVAVIGNFTIYIPYPIVEGNDIFVDVRTTSGTTHPVELTMQMKTIGRHQHNVGFESDRAQDRSDGSTNNTNPSDSSAGDTTSLNASGSTDAKNINVGTEDKTDR